MVDHTSNDGDSTDDDQALKIATLLLALFRGREDVIAVGDSDGMRCRRVESPLGPGQVAAFQLEGDTSYGVYPVIEGDRVWFAGLDRDNKPATPDPGWKDKAAETALKLRDLGLHAIIDVSQSGKAAHVLLFFAEPVPAWMVRQLLAAVVAHLGYREPEIFPRQDSVSQGKVGNALRLPLFNKSHFASPKSWKRLDPVRLLKSIKRTTEEDLQHAADKFGIELVEPGTPVPGSSTIPSGLPLGVQQILITEPDGNLAKRWAGNTEGLRDTSRSSLVFSIACCLIRAYVTTDEVEAAIRCWCSANNYSKGENDDWIELTVDNAYDAVRESAAQWRRKKTARTALPEGTHPAIAREHRRKQFTKKQKRN